MLAAARKAEAAMGRTLTFLACAIFVVLTLDVLWGVVTRFVRIPALGFEGQQALWTDELARFLLVWLTAIGGAVAYRTREHLGLDILVQAMDPSTRRILTVSSRVAVFLFAALVMVLGGASFVADRFAAGQTMTALGIQKAWLYLAIPVGGAAIAFTAAVQAEPPPPSPPVDPGAPDEHASDQTPGGAAIGSQRTSSLPSSNETASPASQPTARESKT